MSFQASLPSISLQLTPPTCGPSLCFSQSTQARNWLFSENQLRDIRSQLHSESAKSLSNLWKEEDRLREQQQKVDQGENQSPSKSTDLDFPSIQECQLLVDFYLAKIPPIVRAFNKPTAVETTAMSYLKRFYTRFTPWQHNVKDVMLTCLFLALKSTNHPLSLKHYSHKVAGKVPTPEQVKAIQTAILGLEFSVSQALDFQYWVLDPAKGVGGLLMGLRSLDPPPSSDLLSSLLPQTLQNLTTSRLTDLEFHFSPSQIMISSFRCISSESYSLIERWLDVLEERATEGRIEMLESRKSWREQDEKRNREVGKGNGNENGVTNGNGNQSHPNQESGLDLKEDELIDRPLGISREELNAILNRIQDVLKKKNEEIKKEKSKEGKEELLEKVRIISRKCEALVDPRDEKVGGSLYQKRLSETESQQQVKRSKKLERSAQKDRDDDPFSTKEAPGNLKEGLGTGLNVKINPGSGGGLFGSEIARIRKEKGEREKEGI